MTAGNKVGGRYRPTTRTLLPGCSIASPTSKSRARIGSTNKLRGVRAALHDLDILVTGGEQDWDLATWRRLIAGRTFDVAQPDVLYVGGVERARRVAAMAGAVGVPVMPHSANLSLVTVFTLHLMGAVPNGGGYVEWSIEGPDYYPWQYGVYEPVLVVEDGHVRIPDGPGWGVDIRSDWLDQAEHQTSETGAE